jgi:Domain of unknown function (DUF4384)
VLAKAPPPALSQPNPPQKQPTALPDPLSITIGSANGAQKFHRGELLSLIVTANQDAYLYCYLQDETQKIQRFYPNRFVKDSYVQAAAPLQIPGKMRFQLVANDKGIAETIACFATDRDVMAALPGAAAGTDFEYLAIASLDSIKHAFVAASGGNFAEGYFNVEVN